MSSTPIRDIITLNLLSICSAPAKISETVPSSSVTAYVGEELTLECFVEGDPSPKIDVNRVGNPLGR